MRITLVPERVRRAQAQPWWPYYGAWMAFVTGLSTVVVPAFYRHPAPGEHARLVVGLTFMAVGLVAAATVFLRRRAIARRDVTPAGVPE